ncbi:UNVERIFIED_CONTAM: protein WHAT'S THIS FACTOR 1, chloroplastic [Sesamum calycinum]|uniref:Protein WHAT'S THIS FACTOR 1, chloroplastic n=1 Tax=Sesamum calycinum TaxID=2727403 RepID=A0AAW2SZL1_9LAMI
MKHGKALELDMEDERKLNILNTLPLVSPYSDGSKLDFRTSEAEKYRVGIIHEFLSLTLEKRAYIHNIVEFKDVELIDKDPQVVFNEKTLQIWGHARTGI